jgi:hypothetical protein
LVVCTRAAGVKWCQDVPVEEKESNDVTDKNPPKMSTQDMKVIEIAEVAFTFTYYLFSPHLKQLGLMPSAHHFYK